MKCAQCGADNRGGARFCEQCGTKIETGIAAAAVASTQAEPAQESLIDEVVESMAQEPGTSKGPGFKIALAFLLLIFIAGLLWAYMGKSGGSQENAASSNPVSGEVQDAGPLRAPSLAEQMGTSVTPIAANALDVKTEQTPAQVKAPADSRRTKDVKTKAQREEELRKKNEERLAQEERDSAARKAALAPRGLSTVQEVANCEKMSVFARQPCLWRACNGKWGKDGCPSYD